MKQLYVAAFTALFLSPAAIAMAQDTAEPAPQEQLQDPAPLIAPAGETELVRFKWAARVILVFADSPLDPSFNEQVSLLESRPDPLLERDVVVLTDTDPEARSPIRTELRPRGFALVIVDKDGRTMLRKPDPWDVREITRAIDKTPLRQQEMESGR
ncbi:DUF4174 domain-containing protein [Celeribacter neptunius]|uniref:DUF4174 domain-containing protein n=1 Tax=Celeribacter neptunius TaxID=588602 RepID=A0A1I3IIP2_9RHOB|nr:DUF4174 domain-containing protein [Celeribacter neptunius]SFI47801.1 protein of unknown function [Celeribacter neptunius]